MAKVLPAVLTGLDPGTSKTAVIIALIRKGALELVGSGEAPSVGIRKGAIENPSLTAKSVKQALEKAEKMAGIRAGRVFVSYCSSNAGVIDFPGGFTMDSHGLYPGASPAITGSGSCPGPAGAPPGRRIVKRLPAVLTRTGPERKQPCSRIVTAPSEEITNLIECVRLAGPAVQEVIYSPLAGSYALLTPAERELGTILLDIGAGLTSISLFNRGLLKETAVLPLGGEHLTGDLAIGLRLSLNQAVEVLKEYELEKTPPEGIHCAGTGVGGAVEGQKPQDLIQSIIEARLTEIFTLAGGVIKGFDYPGPPPGGVVIYGGVSQLSGLSSWAEKTLQMPVRIGRLQNQGLPLNPAFANALGLVLYRLARLPGKKKISRDCREQSEGFVGKVFNWFEDRNKR